MAFGNLLLNLGQSLAADNAGTTALNLGARSHVYAMRAGEREFEPFETGAANTNALWNMWLNSAVGTLAPLNDFADEWEARTAGGFQSLGDLFTVTVVRSGGSFHVSNPTNNSSQWNLLRHINSGGAWTGGFYDAPTLDGTSWTVGPSYSCIDTLQQGITAAREDIEGRALTPRLLGAYIALGPADRLTAAGGAAFYDNMLGLKQIIETASDIAEAPLFLQKLSGGALDRTGADDVNAAMDTLAANFDMTYIIDPTKWPEYDAEDDTTFGGIHTDSIHLAARGTFRAADDIINLTVDNGFYGVELPDL